MTGHVRKRGSKWEVVLELGEQAAQRCPACVDGRGRGKRYWKDKGRLAACPTCGGELEDVTARRQIVLRERYRTKKEAAQRLTRELHSDLSGAFVEPDTLRVGAFLTEHWLPSLQGAPSSLRAYRLHVVHHIVPYIGGLRLQRLTTRDIDLLHARLAREPGPRGRVLSAETRRSVHFVLQRSLQVAVKWNLIPNNPAVDAEKPRRERRAMATWTAEQLGRFLAATDADRLAPLWRLYAMTGMRRGEALALRWEDVDLTAGKVHIQRSRTKDGYHVLERPPKTNRGRTVSIGPDTVRALQRQAAQQLADAHRWGAAWTTSGYVFTREDGQPWHPDRVSDLFSQAVTAMGLPRIRLHDLRHTHATLALQAGINPKVVQERLGHASIKQTMDTYSHVLDVLHESAADLIENLVSAPSQAGGNGLA